MNSKNMAKALKSKLDDWCKHIGSEEVVKLIHDNAIVTGGALVSLLNGEKPNDYDIYFKTAESCKQVAKYYAEKWNAVKDTKVEIRDGSGRITCFIQSKGIAMEDNENGIDDKSEPVEFEIEQIVEDDNKDEKPKYRPRYFSTNAISLSDDIQLVIRFYGDIQEIHTNYDFSHCTCSYDYKTNIVNLPVKALECIINKELFYQGSKYPLCSIIRTRKFIERGWKINAGQYVKMALQLNEIDLKDLNTFKEQLVGVDSVYFSQAIEAIQKKQDENPDFQIDNNYLFEIINRIF